MPSSVYFLGDLGQCSQAADRLTKKQVNPEIESDYERGPDENQSTRIKGETVPSLYLLFLFSLFAVFQEQHRHLLHWPMFHSEVDMTAIEQIECSVLNVLQVTLRTCNRLQKYSPLHPHDPTTSHVSYFFSFSQAIQMISQVQWIVLLVLSMDLFSERVSC